jgi:hypothetical protein
MRAPSAEELAAIAAAYVAVMRTTAAVKPAERRRWPLAGRLGDLDATHARVAARASSRWAIASRLDD